MLKARDAPYRVCRPMQPKDYTTSGRWWAVSREEPTRLTRYGGNRHILYLRKTLVEDSQFPFEPGDELIARIDGERLIVEAQDGQINQENSQLKEGDLVHYVGPAKRHALVHGPGVVQSVGDGLVRVEALYGGDVGDVPITAGEVYTFDTTYLERAPDDQEGD